jgi:saccharopine dehydrogenase (NAD+, L-lysine forming)
MSNQLTIGLLRETKMPPDRRVAIIPEQARWIQDNYPKIRIVVQPSLDRAFSDEEYCAAGITVDEHVENCDILMGVKEVKKEYLIPGKIYLFFAHVTKQQAHNLALFKEIVKKKIHLVDYEHITDEKGIRLVAFGRWAGIVGAYNGIRAIGLKNNWFELKPAWQSKDRLELEKNLGLIELGPVKIVVTGEGRVAGGVMEIMELLKIRRVNPTDFFSSSPSEAVYCQLGPQHYTIHHENIPFDFSQFVKDPGLFISAFKPYAGEADLLISAHFWDPRSPRLFEPEHIADKHFRIRVIADITCDIGGSVPSTQRASSITDPFYDIDPLTGHEEKAFSAADHITVMSVDNLPAELPRDSSTSFGEALIREVIPALAGTGDPAIIERASITRGGRLLPRYGYLQDYLNQNVMI